MVKIQLLVITGIFALIAAAGAALAGPPEQMEPNSVECISSNRDGRRFVGRDVGQGSFEESLYQCYIHTDELSIRSCRVDACREPSGMWTRVSHDEE